MHGLVRWLCGAYPDDRLALLARQALAADARLPDLTRVLITCTKGTIRLTGRVPQAQDRTRIEADIRRALHTAALPYRRLVNQLYVR